METKDDVLGQLIEHESTVGVGSIRALVEAAYAIGAEQAAQRASLSAAGWELGAARELRIKIHGIDPEQPDNKKWLDSVVPEDAAIIRKHAQGGKQ